MARRRSTPPHASFADAMGKKCWLRRKGGSLVSATVLEVQEAADRKKKKKGSRAVRFRVHIDETAAPGTALAAGTKRATSSAAAAAADEWVDAADVTFDDPHTSTATTTAAGKGAGKKPKGQRPAAAAAAATAAAQRTLALFHPDSGSDAESEASQSQPRPLARVFFRNFETQAWFISPYPNGLGAGPEAYICDGCIAAFGSKELLFVHEQRCLQRRHIPGDIVYVDKTREFVVSEVDGRVPACVAFCQRVALLTKFFLHHKMTLADSHYFAFFVLYERDPVAGTLHFAGYFSKEWDIDATCENNLACIMVLPPYQVKGYGNFLMQMSYELSKLEHRLGTPERPLSDLGSRAYISLWGDMVIEHIAEASQIGLPMSVNSIAQSTSMLPEDVLFILHYLGVLKIGASNVVSVIISDEMVARHSQRRLKRKVPFDRALLRWTPLTPPKR